MAKASSQNWGAFILEIIAGILYLYAMATVGGGFAASGWNSTSTAAFWLPILIGIGLVASVGLFFTSFKELTGKSTKDIAMKAVIWGAVALGALTYTSGFSGGSFDAVVLGFILGMIGAGYLSK